MAIRSNAGTTDLILRNENRSGATPLVVFPGAGATSFGYSFWVKLANSIPTVITSHLGTDGSYINIGHDGINWYLSYRVGIGGITTIPFNNITVGQWAVICFSKAGNPTNEVFYAVQPLGDPGTTPLTIVKVITGITINLTFIFDSFKISVANASVCCFKFWTGAAPALVSFQAQASRWDAQNGGFGSTPFWVSPLRTPGDISNIVGIYTSATWNDGHAFTLISSPSNLKFDSDDPIYMAINQPCPTWVYPIIFGGSILTISFNPGTTPAGLTIYKRPDFFQFDDRGSLPLSGTITILYCGFPFTTDAGLAPTYSSALYTNEFGVEVSPDPTLAANKFDTNTTVATPASINSLNIYAYKYRCQFTWTAGGVIATATANLGDAFLYVTYTGSPTGIPRLPASALTGLFVVVKGTNSDKYNSAVELKIPDPTIRTAYIGE